MIWVHKYYDRAQFARLRKAERDLTDALVLAEDRLRAAREMQRLLDEFSREREKQAAAHNEIVAAYESELKYARDRYAAAEKTAAEQKTAPMCDKQRAEAIQRRKDLAATVENNLFAAYFPMPVIDALVADIKRQLRYGVSVGTGQPDEWWLPGVEPQEKP